MFLAGVMLTVPATIFGYRYFQSQRNRQDADLAPDLPDEGKETSNRRNSAENWPVARKAPPPDPNGELLRLLTQYISIDPARKPDHGYILKCVDDLGRERDQWQKASDNFEKKLQDPLIVNAVSNAEARWRDEVSAAKERADAFSLAATTAKNDSDGHLAELEEQKRENESLQQELVGAKDQATTAEKALAREKRNNATLTGQLQQAREREDDIARKENELAAAGEAQQIDTERLTAALQAAEGQTALIQEHPLLIQKRDALQAQVEELEDNLRNAQAGLDQARQEKEGLTQSLGESEKNLDGWRAESERQAGLVGGLENEKTRLADDLAAKERQRAEVEARLNAESKYAAQLDAEIARLREFLPLPRSVLPTAMHETLQDWRDQLLARLQTDPQDPQTRRMLGSLIAFEAELGPQCDEQTLQDLLSSLGRQLYVYLQQDGEREARPEAERWAAALNALLQQRIEAREFQITVIPPGSPFNPIRMNKQPGSGSGSSVTRVDSWLVGQRGGVVRKALVTT